eukprot:s76_g37.t1
MFRDMAFTRENFLQEALQTNSFFSDFDAILNFEATMGMKMVLAGSDFASTGVANAKTAESHRVLEVALRDTMVTAYAAALEGQSDAHPPDAELREASYDTPRHHQAGALPHNTCGGLIAEEAKEIRLREK